MRVLQIVALHPFACAVRPVTQESLAPEALRRTSVFALAAVANFKRVPSIALDMVTSAMSIPAGIVLPDSLEPVRCQLRVPHSVLDVPVPHVVLDGPRVLARTADLGAAIEARIRNRYPRGAQPSARSAAGSFA